MLCGQLQQTLQGIHGEDEEHGQKGVALTNPSAVAEIRPMLACAHAKKDGYPFAPMLPEDQGLQYLQQITLVDCVKSFVDVQLQKEGRGFLFVKFLYCGMDI